MNYSLCPPPDSASLQCPFEDDRSCGFQQDSTDDFNWLHTTGGWPLHEAEVHFYTLRLILSSYYF